MSYNQTTESKIPDGLDHSAQFQSINQHITTEDKVTNETTALSSQLSDTSSLSEHPKNELENVETQIINEVKCSQTSEPGAVDDLLQSDNKPNKMKDIISDKSVDSKSFNESEPGEKSQLTKTKVVQTNINTIENVEQLIPENRVEVSEDLIDFGETENGKCFDEETRHDSIRNKVLFKLHLTPVFLFH